MKPTFDQYLAAVRKCGRFVPFWPQGEEEEKDLVGFFDSMIGTVEQLSWFTNAVLNGVRKWPGFPELRGLFCSKYAPADGFTAECNLEGFRATDCENEYIARIAHETELKLIQAREETKMLPAPEPLRLEDLARAKALPAPRPKKKSLREVEAEIKQAAALARPIGAEERARRLRELEQRIGKPGSAKLS